MRFVQYYMKGDSDKKRRVGIFSGGADIIDFKTIDKNSPDTLIEILKQNPDLLGKVSLECFKEFENDTINVDDVELLAPITGCDKVICVGMNYRDHCEEQNVPIPKEPIFFNKFPSCLHGPFATVPYPAVTTELDWEVELAVIIGKKGKNISEGEAYNHVFGYSVAHDVSARDWQLSRNGGQWLIGKAMDGFCPLGPSLVTKDQVPDPHNLDISCRLNGETKQKSNTKNLLFQVPQLIANLSRLVTLLPGDVILTGTPPGVGVFAEPPCFIRHGDSVECEIEMLGRIRNDFIP